MNYLFLSLLYILTLSDWEKEVKADGLRSSHSLLWMVGMFLGERNEGRWPYLILSIWPLGNRLMLFARKKRA